MRLAACFAVVLALAQPALAAPDAPYYGPMKPWHGLAIAYKYGYRDHPEADGTWRIEVALRSGEAIDMAVYRAADLAREQGYPYVQFLSGSESPAPGHHSATVWIRLSREPGAPVGCRSKAHDTCYTANVAEVLRVLGGPDGTQPGVAIVDHYEHGLEVRMGGYGAGDVTKMPVRAALPVPISMPRARVAVRSAPSARPVLSEAERYQAALRAAQPM